VAIVRCPNPFHPTFGRPPHTLVGRDEAMGRCRAAMSAGPDHPDYSMLLKGPRGSGKTVLLAAVRDMAERNGLATVRVTAKPEPTFADALIEQMSSESAAERRRVSSAQVSVLGSGTGVSFRAPESRELSVHTRMLDAMEHLAERAQRNAKGALITIDEFHNANIAALRDFAHALKDVAKIDGKPVMFVGAGLPSMEETALADQGMTFFQRIARTQLDPLSPEESAEALRAPIEAAGGTIGDEALTTAAAATSGYPFMVQLVGYHAWEGCADPGDAITPDDVRAAIGAATGDMEVQVFAPLVRDLSDTDRLVLDAMSAFDTPEIKISDLARAAGKTSNYLSVYIERLREAGVIDRPARGRVRFVHATMRDWLHRQRAERGAAVGGFGPPETTTTVKERIIATCRSNPEATHAAIAARVGTSPDYVGRVRRADGASVAGRGGGPASGGGDSSAGDRSGRGAVEDAAPSMEWPFSLVEPEVFREAGVARKDEAVELAADWLGDMVDGRRRFRWVEQGPGTVIAEPDPDLPCTVFAGAREFAGCWVPTLFLMAGRRGTTCYWQWATSGSRQAPLLGAKAIDGVEWVIDMLLPIVRSSIRSPAA